MNLFVTVLEIVAPVFLLALVGFAWVKFGFEYRVEFVTRLAMTLAAPCLMFTALMKTDIDPAALTTLSIASLATYGAIALVLAIGLKLAGLEQRTYLVALIFGNTGNLGLPLALFAFGPEGLSYALVVFAVMAVLSFTFGIWVVSGGGSFLRALKEPIVSATLLGALFLWQGWETPRFLTSALELIGQMLIPLMLITLGVAVARLTPGRIGQAFVLSFIKVALCSAIAFGIAGLFDLNEIARAVLIVQIATPVAVTSYMLAEKYGADADAVAGLVVVSTLMSVAAIPLLLAILL
ncbi:MAG: AEC family transporter [Planktotalea sp.]|uniref:AEC family transporter n=1 Tax=Planktotalea sp. TaxID=2029877 RepID=UPI003C789C33